LVWPLVKGIRYVAAAPVNPLRRARAVGLSVLGVVAAYLALFALPIPSNTASDGIVWLPDESMVRLDTDCFVSSVEVESGAMVREGSVLMACDDPDLRAEREILEARVGALRLKYRGLGLREQIERRLVADEIAAAETELARIRERIDALTVTSPVRGTFVRMEDGFLPGRFYGKGEALGFVLADPYLTVKAALRQEDVDLVSRHRSVSVRFAGAPEVEHRAALLRQVPAATRRLPSAALGTAGGGSLAVDPQDPEGRMVREDVYLVDLALQSAEIPRLVGLRAHVLFRHGSTVIADLLSRKVRLLFMRHINV
jgi:putative peptide zinc metalloprotease protein